MRVAVGIALILIGLGAAASIGFAAKKPPRIVLVAAPDTPAGVYAIKNLSWRAFYLREVRMLDAVLAQHPVLRPLRNRLWYLGFNSRSDTSPHQLAGLVWCAVYDPMPCRLVHGVLQSG